MADEIMLVLAVCADMFFAAFSYGKNRIGIPFFSMLAISLTGAAVLVLAVGFSEKLSLVIPERICIYGGAAVLIIIGCVYIFGDFFRSCLKKLNTDNRQVRIMIDKCSADEDGSKELSVKEALLLSVSLSADSLASGMGAGFIGMNIIRIFITAAVGGMLMMGTGLLAGKYLDMKVKGNFSWIGGAMLVILGLRRLF